MSSGRGLRGVVVTLHDLEGAVLGRAHTDADGAFTLASPPADSPVDSSSATAVLIVSSSDHRPYARLVRPAGATTLPDVELAPVGDVAGSVHDADGEPVDGATVSVSDATGAVCAVRRTDPDGTFDVAGLDPGHYTVAVLAAGREPVASTLTVGPDGQARHDVVVDAVPSTVAGTLRSSTGWPVSESLVVLVGEDGSVRASTATDAEGRFRLDGLAPGRCMLTASGFAPVTRDVTVHGADPEPVDIVIEPPRPLPAAEPARAADTVGAAEDQVPTGPVADVETLRSAARSS